MNNLKNEKGITLVALVITIVVLTIIATITISTSMVGNELIDDTLNTTKDAQINKYRELIEITRQEAMSREYVLEMKPRTGTEATNDVVLNEMLRIMKDEVYADKAYVEAREIENNFSIGVSNTNQYIIFQTIEGYVFNIYKDRTEYRS